MIFVTVGTHEQPMNRLLQELDRLIETNAIQEEVIIQNGYSDFEVRGAKMEQLLPFKEMQKNMEAARIVITHGGAATYLQVLAFGKVPVVVPRSFAYHEHVNDHQLEFAQKLVAVGYQLEIVEDMADLELAIKHAATLTGETKSHNAEFNQQFKEVIDELFNKG